MTRHQRRKANAIRKEAAIRNEIVRQNLSQPVEQVRIRGAQVSTVYANRMDRARGRGTTPIHRLSERVIKVEPGACAWNRDA